MQAGVIAAARYINNVLIGDDATWQASLVTLTYTNPDAWDALHIKKVLEHYRKWYRRHGLPFYYVWTLEMQKRGAPHYHIVLWVKGRTIKRGPRAGQWIGNGQTPPFPDAQGWWPHGSSNAIFAVSPVGYIAKYASKGPGSRLPAGARIWGHGGLDADGKSEVARALAPRWLRSVVSPAAQLKRVSVMVEEVRKRGQTALIKVAGFLDKLTGFVFFSPWVFDGFDANGLALRHKGYVEALSPEGDYFQIHQDKGVFA